MDSYTLFGRGKGLIQIVQELLYEISVFGDVPGLYPLYFHCMINYCSTFISFWQKILNLTVFGFLTLDGFQFLGFFFKYWPAKKCQQRHNIFGVCSSWPGFSFKMCNFSEFDEDWRSDQHIKQCIGGEWLLSLHCPTSFKPRTGDSIKCFISGLL